MLDWLATGISPHIGIITIIVTILACAFLASFSLKRLLGWYLKKVEGSGSPRLSVTMTSFASKSVSVLVYSIAFITIHATLKVQITPFLAGLGIIGIAVALASQELFSNFFGALTIFFDKPYKVGDRITLPSGATGDVIDIGMRSTRIKTLDNIVIIAPNSKVASATITNRSEPDHNYRYTLRFSIAYGADIDKASALLLDIVKGMRGVLEKPAPEVYVSRLGEYSVELVLLVWAEDFRRDSDIPDRVYPQVCKRFAAEGIEMPYPTRTVGYP
jgi:MscS family membrane protein